MKFPLHHPETQDRQIKESDCPISLRELLQQFGFCEAQDQETLEETGRFLASFASPLTAATVLKTLGYTIESRSRDRLTSYLQINFPEIHLAYVLDNLDDSNPD